MAENVRDYGMRVVVLQRFRSRGSIIREGATIEGHCSDPKRAPI